MTGTAPSPVRCAVEEAAALHRASNPAVPFEHVLAWHHQDGLVWTFNGQFMLARPGFWDGHTFVFGEVPANCWFVYVAVGRRAHGALASILHRAAALPFVAWHRHGQTKLHVTRLERFLP